MKDQEKLDLMELVESDKHHIIQFLLAQNLKVKEGEVSLHYSEGEGEPYLNLWEVEEPHLVRAEFVIERPKEVDRSVSKTLDLLIDKITTRGWPDHAYHPVAYTQQLENTCTHLRRIKIQYQPQGILVSMLGGICYCS